MIAELFLEARDRSVLLTDTYSFLVYIGPFWVLIGVISLSELYIPTC